MLKYYGFLVLVLGSVIDMFIFCLLMQVSFVSL